ncbi:MAG: hypothetical protein V7K97_04650 [Nostoc sp.]|uniref:hypothetical protein n=1 Tax=Nostoc sp. TaxID=1180 RepID=UPI002FF904C4
MNFREEFKLLLRARKLRNLARLLKSQPKNIVLLSPRIAILDDCISARHYTNIL